MSLTGCEGGIMLHDSQIVELLDEDCCLIVDGTGCSVVFGVFVHPLDNKMHIESTITKIVNPCFIINPKAGILTEGII
jgi:hypothetical protein